MIGDDGDWWQLQEPAVVHEAVVAGCQEPCESLQRAWIPLAIIQVAHVAAVEPMWCGHICQC